MPIVAQPILISACQTGDLSTLKELLRLGASPRAVDDLGCGLLHHAAANGSLHVAVALIQTGVDIDARGHQGLSPLHVAAHNGQAEAAQVLIANGAKLNREEPFAGRTPLHIAATDRGHHTAAVLLAAGARVDARDFQGKTALHCAAYNGSLAAATVLLQNGASCNACEEDGGRTPLDAALEAGHQDVAAYLRQEGGKTKSELNSLPCAMSLKATLHKFSSLLARTKKGKPVTVPVPALGRRHSLSEAEVNAGRPSRSTGNSPPLTYRAPSKSTDLTDGLPAPPRASSLGTTLPKGPGSTPISAQYLQVEPQEWSKLRKVPVKGPARKPRKQADRNLIGEAADSESDSEGMPGISSSLVFVRRDTAPGRQGSSNVPPGCYKIPIVQPPVEDDLLAGRRASCSSSEVSEAEVH